MFPEQKQKPILLIEDNADDALLTIRAFKRNRFSNEVIVARDGVEALELLFGSGGDALASAAIDPQLILLDLKLPKIDGHGVLRRIREDRRTRLLPVVVLTSSREPEDVALSYELGANSYIRKEVDYLRFSETIRELGHYWLGLNEAPPLSRK